MSKILIADDSNVAQRMGKEILVAEGYEVLTVNNGHTALKKLNTFAPDLILADIFMPGATGYELCQAVRSDNAFGHIPIVLMVGAMEPYDKDEARRVGADGILTKPLQSTDVVVLVSDLLAPSRDRIGDGPEDAVAEETPQNLAAIAAEAASISKWGAKASSPVDEDAEYESVEHNSIAAKLNAAGEPYEEPAVDAGPPVSAFQELLEPSASAVSAMDMSAEGAVLGAHKTPSAPMPFSGPSDAPVYESPNETPVRLEFSPPGKDETGDSELSSAQVRDFEASVKPSFSVPEFPAALSQLEQSISSETEKPEESSLTPALADASFMAVPSVEESASDEAAEQAAETEPEVAETLHHEPVEGTLPASAAAGLQWSAVPVEVTDADRNLFEKAFPDWDGIAKLVHGSGQDEEPGFDSSRKQSGNRAPAASEAARPETSLAMVATDEVEPLVLETPSHTPAAGHAESNAPVLELEPAPEARAAAESRQAIDPTALHQMILDSVESLIPEIVTRIVGAVESALLKPHSDR